MGTYDPIDRSDLKNKPEQDNRTPARNADIAGRETAQDKEAARNPPEPATENGGLSHGSQPKM
jgi:hypothetical protein